jgi:hypothetical protein
LCARLKRVGVGVDPTCVTRAALVLAVLLAFGATACGGKKQTERELRAERLVQLQVMENVTCHDVHAVNTDVVPNASVNFNCENDDGETYVAVVTADGYLTSLSGPVRIQYR